MEVTITPPARSRILSIDLLRGIVMIIMALDHVRDYFHRDAFIFDPTDLTQTNPALFFTRWITHFCAPVFVFLAGTSAYLVGVRKGKNALSKFLFTRGLWLVFLEAVVVTFGWEFAIHAHTIALQTIWALGVSMIVLSLLIRLPKTVILIISILIIAGHNALDNIHVSGQGADAILWSVIHDPNFFQSGSFSMIIAYPVLAWIGLMGAGYCFGQFYTNYSPERRKKILLWIGSLAIILFIIIRFSNLYGDRAPWSHQPSFIFTLMSFLNCTKYPPSLLYMLMTIGPAIIFLGLSKTREVVLQSPIGRRVSIRISNIISTYGRVPMFYYLLHIYFIHLAALTAAQLSGYKWSDMVYGNWISFNPALRGYGFSLGFVYLVWIIITIILYPLCRWYDKYKSRHRDKWWLSYL